MDTLPPIVFLTLSLVGATGFLEICGRVRESAVTRRAKRDIQAAEARAFSEVEAARTLLTTETVARKRAEDHIGRLTPQLAVSKEHLKVLYTRLLAFEKMKEVWRRGVHNEDECEVLFRQNPWVLLPDYRIDDHQFLDKMSISSLLSRYFLEEVPNPAYHLGLKSSFIPDVCAEVRVDSALQSETGERARPVLLVVELKSSKEKIELKEVDQACAYGMSLTVLAKGKTLKDLNKPFPSRIDCLVIGPSVEPNAEDVRVRWGAPGEGIVRVIPMTYDQLIDRAYWMIRQLLPTELPDAASLLGPHKRDTGRDMSVISSAS